VICLLSLVGVPPLAGFFGKLLLFAVALDAGFGWLVSSANSVLSLAVYMRLLATAYQRPADTRMPSLSVVAAACTVIVVGLGLMYDTVLQLDAEQSTKPLLATDVKASQDGTAYEITVRSGVRWHDGKPLTADDVKFTYEYFLANTQGQFTTSLLAPVDSITTSGADKLTVKLKSPYRSFTIRAPADVPIMPKHVWEGVPGEKTKETLATVGSGPYKLLECTNILYRMRANKDNFLGPPLVGELLFPVIKDANTALQALRIAEIQGWTQRAAAQAGPAVRPGAAESSQRSQLRQHHAAAQR